MSAHTTAIVACPECGEEITIEIAVQTVGEEDGALIVECTPLAHDLEAHARTHGEVVDE